jgi:hypothetical protein
MTKTRAWLLAAAYPWWGSAPISNPLAGRFQPPAGFVREAVTPGSFAEWLRGLPLRPGQPPVRLHDGRLKANQGAHLAVVDIDVGRRDLQQCADAVIRLRAEYLFGLGQAAAVSFRFSSGDPAPFSRWARGARSVVHGSTVSWVPTAPPDATYPSFRRYLDLVFQYAGSRSLAGELVPVAIEQLMGGDVFIQGGSPGHAVIVIDTARDGRGNRSFLLAQSYMPAQQIHVLKEPSSGGAWYRLRPGPLDTPEWTFPAGSLRRFPALAGEPR